MRRSRRWTAPAALTGLLAISGCSVSGTVDILTDQVVLDVVVVHTAPRGPQSETGWATQGGAFYVDVCGGWNWRHVTKRGLPAPEGEVSCRLQGRIPREGATATVGEFSESLVTYTSDHVYAMLPLAWFVASPYSEPLDSIDLTVSFPGRVIAASDGVTASDRLAHITDADAVNRAGVRVTAEASDRVDPLWWAVGAALAAGAALGGFGVWSLLRRLGSPTADDPADATPDAPAADGLTPRGPAPASPHADPPVPDGRAVSTQVRAAAPDDRSAHRAEGSDTHGGRHDETPDDDWSHA